MIRLLALTAILGLAQGLSATDSLQWQREVLDVPQGYSLHDFDAAYTPDGQLGIAYVSSVNDQETLVYTTDDSGTFQTQTIAPLRSNNIQTVSLDYDDAGHPVVSYQEFDDLMLATYDGSTWSVESLWQATYSDMSIAPDGTLAIAYQELDTNELFIARFDGSTWQHNLVDGDDAGHNCQLLHTPAGETFLSLR